MSGLFYPDKTDLVMRIKTFFELLRCFKRHFQISLIAIVEHYTFYTGKRSYS